MSLLLALAIGRLPSPHGDDTHVAAKDYRVQCGTLRANVTFRPPGPSMLLSTSLY